jgi:G3E family GTPase
MNGSLARVPCTIVTGFLGAGKTTLIRHVIANAQGRRLAVIVNEFGDVGIDGEILKGCGNAACPEDNIVELANGCLCCTVADEFAPALDAILARNGVEHIVIETSGLALPKPLVQAFHWPAIKNRPRRAQQARPDRRDGSRQGAGGDRRRPAAQRQDHHHGRRQSRSEALAWARRRHRA